jgi:hypothetical protein
MAVNSDKPAKWKSDIVQSVDMYNDWFMKFAPKAFRETRIHTTYEVAASLNSAGNFISLGVGTIRKDPGIIRTLRMSTCPPLAVDRLIGLAGVSPNLIKCLEDEHSLPRRMSDVEIESQLGRVVSIFRKMLDPDIFVWLARKSVKPTDLEVHRAATIVADRMCGAVANPIIRNA